MVCSLCAKTDACVICGKCVHEAGGSTYFQGKCYCTGSKSNCFEKTFVKEYADVEVVKKIDITCPFCKQQYLLHDGNIADFNFPYECSCGAILTDESEYGTKENIMVFKRR